MFDYSETRLVGWHMPWCPQAPPSTDWPGATHSVKAAADRSSAGAFAADMDEVMSWVPLTAAFSAVQFKSCSTRAFNAR